ncbi:MAG: nuclear transport factor 2 family protein [Acidimicrobiia bacterium]|nr:nuclear transport factor 2 family protein [Acidimicrobiia bacterium]MDH5236098.1 nuclear transport factor 2 family protein [Acidimicrobiia bacterium]
MDDTADYIALRRLQSAYADIVTRRAWTELGALFEPACPVILDLRDRGTMEFTGADEIGAFIARSIEVFEFFRFEVVNTTIEIGIGGDPDLAGARMYMCELRRHRDDGDWSAMHGLYVDQMRRSADGWRFAKRRYHSVGRQGADSQVFDWPGVGWTDI